jgi:hypothetical protein
MLLFACVHGFVVGCSMQVGGIEIAGVEVGECRMSIGEVIFGLAESAMRKAASIEPSVKVTAERRDLRNTRLKERGQGENDAKDSAREPV